MKPWLGILAILLGACTASGGPRPGGVSEQAVSKQSTRDDAAKDRARIHTELGSLYMQDGNLAIALEEARIALASDSGYAPAYNLVALVHMNLQENPAAEENFRKALSLAQGDPEINNNYGWFLCQTGREQDSLQYFLNAIKNPYYTTPAKPYTNAGLCAIRLNNDKLAEDYLVRAIRSDPRTPIAYYWLADIQFRTNRLHEARSRIADLHRIVEPNAESAWLALRIERKLGDREGEARFAGQLRRRFQGSPEHQKLMQGQYE
jgi:type IV pilus assembly protein PilF